MKMRNKILCGMMAILLSTPISSPIVEAKGLNFSPQDLAGLINILTDEHDKNKEAKNAKNSKATSKVTPFVTHDEITPTVKMFFQAIDKNDLQTIKFLLDRGAISINSRYDGYGTPLSRCFFNGYGEKRDAAQLLLEHGADVTGYTMYAHDSSVDRFSYLCQAAMFQELELVKYLHNWGAPIDQTMRIKSYMVGSQMLDYKGDVETGQNALHAFCWGIGAYYTKHDQHIFDDMVDYLISNGIDVNAKTDSGNTAVMILAGNRQQGYGELKLHLVKLLVENYGANVKLKNTDGKTAFDIASEHYHYDMAKYLMSKQ